MQLNDDWIRRNIGTITPGTAKFLLERAARQKIILSRDVIFLLDARVRGEPQAPVSRRPDWAERAAGEKNE
jgi:hypothetical protein